MKKYSFIPTTIINGASQSKLEEKWNKEDNKEFLYDKKSKFFIAFALEIEEFFWVSNCKTTKKI